MANEDWTRRQVMVLLGGAALLPFVGCDDGGGAADGSDASPNDGSCAEVPEETGGPYPGDGTNGPDALTLSGINRSDIRSSIAGVVGTAAGVMLTVKLTVVDGSASCAPLAGKAVYIWHCDRDGNYSMYTGAAQSQNYLRGVQVTDADGAVTFMTIFPACYSGRWPHIHFEIYDSLAAATSGGSKLKTSQLALPKSTCDSVYTTSGYSQSVSNLAQVSLSSDMVFSDGADLETPTVTGNTTDGLTAALRVAV